METGPPPGGGETILVVDDEEVVRRSLRVGLERWGYTVVLAADGVEALELFGRHQQEVDLVLLDLSMPRLSGGETLAALRQLDPAVKVLVLTGYAARDIAMDGAQGVIQKPVSMAELLRLMRTSLDG